ncbi:MAG TPA: ATP-binding protein, partial [Rhodospirillales bacterium]|nr:ATP-binding protein [Rhodospirillales bacterium]
MIVPTNLPFDEWTSVFGSERLTGARLDRLTHHVHILEFNGESYRLKRSKGRRRSTSTEVDPGFGTSGLIGAGSAPSW